MRYLAVLIVLIFTFGPISRAQAQQPPESKITNKKNKKKKNRRRRQPKRKARKDTRPPQVAIDYALCAKTHDNQRNTFELKTTNHLCVLRGKDADTFIEKQKNNTVCKHLEKALTCPSTTQKHREVGIVKHRVLSCAITCHLPNGASEGPASKIYPEPKRRYKTYGPIFYRGKYKAGKKVGLWEKGYWNRSDFRTTKITETSMFNASGELNGAQRQWDRTGRISGKQIYRKNVKISDEFFSQNGQSSKSFYKNAQIVESVFWKRGVKTRRVRTKRGTLETTYDMDGHVITVGRYPLRNGQHQHFLKSGVWKSFHANGSVKSIQHYNARGSRHGIFRKYDNTGALLESGTYFMQVDVYHGGKAFRSKKAGRWVSFSSKDVPKGLENYNHIGIPDGKFCRWDEKGKLLRCSVMKNGTGILYKYSTEDPRDNYQAIPYKKNKLHGKKFSVRNGKRTQESEWRDGKMHGLSVSIVRGSRKLQRYFNGKPHGEYCKGNEIHLTYGDFCHGRRCGEWIWQGKRGIRKTTFSTSGKKMKEEKYPTPKDASYECPQR